MNDAMTLVIAKCSRPGGVTSRELRDMLHAARRAEVYPARDAALRAGTIIRCAHRFVGHKVESVRYFAQAADAAHWVKTGPVVRVYKPAKAEQKPQLARREILRLDPRKAADSSQAHVVVCPTFVDDRYTVTLPKGYVSQINPNDCRPWALTL